MNRRTFIKSTAAASAVALLRPNLAQAALPQAKITKISFYEAPNVMPLQIPLLQSNMVVTIETDANLTGIGEGGTPDSLTPCAGRLIGKNPFEIGRHWQDMYRAFHYPPGRERLHAMGALDLALWDLKGKALGVPVYELLGGSVRNHLECYTTGFRGGGTTLRDRAAACMDAGWRLFRFDAASVRGTSTYDVRERMKQMQDDCREARAGVGPKGNFMVDFHQRFTLTEAARGCRLIEEFEPFAVEDPVETDSFLQDIPKLRKMTILPIAAGEELGARWDFLPLVENHDLDYIRVSLPNTGGITEMIRICSICETHDVGIMPHFTGPIATAAQVHALAPFPQSVVFEYNYTGRPIAYLNEFITFKEGKVYTNDRPGLGVTLNMEQLKLVASIDRPGATRPTYYRPDGSQFTW